LDDIQPFKRTYVRLLLSFRSELSQSVLNAALERQKQLNGQKYDDEGWDDLIKISGNAKARHASENSYMTREAQLNSMLFCALLDTREPDFYYFVEPIFDFAEGMELEPKQLQQILESEFVGFKV
jgi:hypothetical protein